MPYIKEENKWRLNRGGLPSTPGELNYVLTEEALSYLRDKGESYQVYNDIIGALEGCKLEMYRRMVAPYEDKKIQENGDVY